jgi:hypothetical protein
MPDEQVSAIALQLTHDAPIAPHCPSFGLC